MMGPLFSGGWVWWPMGEGWRAGGEGPRLATPRCVARRRSIDRDPRPGVGVGRVEAEHGPAVGGPEDRDQDARVPVAVGHLQPARADEDEVGRRAVLVDEDVPPPPRV